MTQTEVRASRVDAHDRRDAGIPPVFNPHETEAMFGHPNDGRPWYRREPWLLAGAVALALTVAAVPAPPTARNVILVLAGVAMLISAVLLVRR